MNHALCATQQKSTFQIYFKCLNDAYFIQLCFFRWLNNVYMLSEKSSIKLSMYVYTYMCMYIFALFTVFLLLREGNLMNHYSIMLIKSKMRNFCGSKQFHPGGDFIFLLSALVCCRAWQIGNGVMKPALDRTSWEQMWLDNRYCATYIIVSDWNASILTIFTVKSLI